MLESGTRKCACNEPSSLALGREGYIEAGAHGAVAQRLGDVVLVDAAGINDESEDKLVEEAAGNQEANQCLVGGRFQVGSVALAGFDRLLDVGVTYTQATLFPGYVGVKGVKYFR